MAYLNILSICVLVAAVASGDCFFSNLMNEPLNFAVSLLDGQGKSRPASRTTLIPYPSNTMSSGESSTQIITNPNDDAIEIVTNGPPEHKVLAKKMNLIRDSFKSMKSKIPKVHVSSGDFSGSGVSEDSGFGSSSEEYIPVPGKSKNYWKNDRGYKRVVAKPMNARNQRLLASISNKRGHGNAIVHASPLIGGKVQQSGWKKNTWFANKVGGSEGKVPTVKAILEPKNKFASGSSEEYIIIAKSAKPSWRSSKFRPNMYGYSNQGAASFTNKRRLPIIKATKLCGVCS